MKTKDKTKTEKIIFACDLDDTLIHSYKKRRENDICIEWVEEREQSFIDRDIYDKIADISDEVIFVPITTRAIRQYKRIKWKDGKEPKYAVTTNGAVLLYGGEEDMKWREDSEKVRKNYEGEMKRIISLLQEENNYRICRMVDDMFIFAYCNDGVDIEERVMYYSGKTKLYIAYHGRKIYIMPSEFNKGAALVKLKEKFGAERIIAAGDSGLDVSMLNEADIAYCREKIKDEVKNGNKRVFSDERELINSVIDLIRR